MRQWFLIGTDVKPHVGSFTRLDTHMISRRQRVRLSAIRLEKSHRAICEITLRNHVLGLCECTFGQNRNFSAGVRWNWQLIDQAAGEWKTKTRQGRVGGGVDRKNLRRLSIEDLHSQRRRGMIVVSGSTQWHMDDAARANTKR